MHPNNHNHMTTSGLSGAHDPLQGPSEATVHRPDVDLSKAQIEAPRVSDEARAIVTLLHGEHRSDLLGNLLDGLERQPAVDVMATCIALARVLQHPGDGNIRVRAASLLKRFCRGRC